MISSERKKIQDIDIIIRTITLIVNTFIDNTIICDVLCNNLELCLKLNGRKI